MVPTMKNTDTQQTIKVAPQLYTLLQRCSLIEAREIDEILETILSPYLKRYTHDTLEQWEEVREIEEGYQILQDFERNNNFNPNEIPFNSQILGLRRKLDDLEREIDSSQKPRPDLEQIRFSILEDLNYAEKEALQKQKDDYESLSKKWKSVCAKIPIL